MKYGTILLDADGTLFDFHRGEAEAIRETMMLVNIAPTDALVAAYSKINESMWKMLERGEIQKSELLYRRFDVFCERFGFVADTKKMADYYISVLSGKSYLFEGAEEFCQKLSKKADLYIVTNGHETVQKGRFAICPLQPYIRKLFISGELGYEKPDVRYFEAVASGIPDFDRSRTVIVGDSLSSDMKGGIAFGIDTCWYNPSGESTPPDMPITYVASDFDSLYEMIVSA